MNHPIRDNSYEVRPGDRLIQLGPLGGPQMMTRTYLVTDNDNGVLVAYAGALRGQEAAQVVGDQMAFDEFDLKDLRERQGWVVLGSEYHPPQHPRPWGVGGVA